jgi:hypothetical protein
MHLGLARAQLLPRSDGYRRFTGSPIDALVYLVIGCGLSCQIPIRLALRYHHPTGASQPSHSGGPRAGEMCGGSDSTPMWFRMWRIFVRCG